MTVSRARLAIGAALALIAVAVYLVFDLNRSGREQVTARFNNYERLRAQQIAHDVETYLETSSVTLLHLARIASDAGDDSNRLRAEVQAFAMPTPGFISGSITVVDQAGGLLYSTGGDFHSAAPGTSEAFEWARKTENRGRVQISSQTGEPQTHAGVASGDALVLVTPYWRTPSEVSAASQKWGGLLVMTLDLQALLSGRLALSSTADQHLGFWIMDQEGVVLLQSDHPEMVRANLRKADTSCLQCHVSFDYVEKMIADRQGTAVYQLKDRPSKLAAFAPVAFANARWIVVVDASQTELMVCELPTDHPAQESIKEIFKATRRATDLVRQILTFSRQQEQERRSIEVSSVAKEALKLLRATLPAFTTKPPGEGTGLGLAVVHGIVKGHEGAISVRSEPGVGTTFDIYFPAAERGTGEGAAVVAAPRGQGQRILFVDDEPALCRVVNRILSDLGYQIETCSTPEEALDRFQAQPGTYDLVITDLAMPGMSGRELAGRLLELRPGQRVVMVTGFSGSLTPEKARTLGLRAVLHKPLDAATLGRAVHDVLRAS